MGADLVSLIATAVSIRCLRCWIRGQDERASRGVGATKGDPRLCFSLDPAVMLRAMFAQDAKLGCGCAVVCRSEPAHPRRLHALAANDICGYRPVRVDVLCAILWILATG